MTAECGGVDLEEPTIEVDVSYCVCRAGKVYEERIGGRYFARSEATTGSTIVPRKLRTKEEELAEIDGEWVSRLT